jgi:hypothetical protein
MEKYEIKIEIHQVAYCAVSRSLFNQCEGIAEGDTNILTTTDHLNELETDGKAWERMILENMPKNFQGDVIIYPID